MPYIRLEYKPTRITGSSVTTIAARLLHSLCINSPSGVIKIWDSSTVGADASAISIIGSNAAVLSDPQLDWTITSGSVTFSTPNANSDFTVGTGSY